MTTGGRVVGALRCYGCPTIRVPGDEALLAFANRHRTHGLTLKRRSPGMPAGTVALVCVTCNKRRPVLEYVGLILMYHDAAHQLYGMNMTENRARVLAALRFDPLPVAAIVAASGVAIQACRDSLRALEGAKYRLAQETHTGGNGRGDVALWRLPVQ